jgi:putative ATP-dependent endonuclease of the OLD family
MSDVAIIRQLRIERFRGIQELTWNPGRGLNLILGGGDVGKTTILEAVALLLNPTSNFALSEADYWQRRSSAGFLVRAVVSLPFSTEVHRQTKFAWPWLWNGQEAVLPTTSNGDDAPTAAGVPVYQLQVRGSPDLDLSWEILQPDGQTDALSSALRRRIGVLRLCGDDRGDRDLRLVYGSALDRLLSDSALRARIGQELASIDLQDRLSVDAKRRLAELDGALQRDGLPHRLKLGLTSSQGLSIGALVGLLAESREAVPLPLASWGTGTRRMATLQIAAATQSETRISVIDEIERGLEPYRVSKLVRSLQADHSQSFITTHSAVAINASDEADLWYLDSMGHIGALDRSKIANQQRRDPGTFLAKLAVICEGSTEVGFVSELLERAVSGRHQDHGIHVASGQGNPHTLELLEAMAAANLVFAGFADNEGVEPGRWRALRARLGDRLFQWATANTEKCVIDEIEDATLVELLRDGDGDFDGNRLRTLADRLGTSEKDLETLLSTISDRGTTLRAVIVAASTGSVHGAPVDRKKEWKGHGRFWFKSVEGGRELARRMFALGAWPALQPTILPFLNAIRESVGQQPLKTLASD